MIFLPSVKRKERKELGRKKEEMAIKNSGMNESMPHQTENGMCLEKVGERNERHFLTIKVPSPDLNETEIRRERRKER